MAQPVKKNISTTKKKTTRKPTNGKRKHKEYGTSKLEDKFAKEFLEKIGVKYERQFKAESIGRYYDFYIPDAHLLIEVDGDYYHGKDMVWEDKSPMQKRNDWVDRHKDAWALNNGYKLIRVWESDINKEPEKVMKRLKEIIGEYCEKQRKIRDKNRRH